MLYKGCQITSEEDLPVYKAVFETIYPNPSQYPYLTDTILNFLLNTKQKSSMHFVNNEIEQFLTCKADLLK